MAPWFAVWFREKPMPDSVGDTMLTTLDEAVERIRKVFDRPGDLFQRCIDSWMDESSGGRPSSIERLIRRLLSERSKSGDGGESTSWLFVGYLALQVVGKTSDRDRLDDLATWRPAFRTHASRFPATEDWTPTEYAPDHLLWWKLRRASQAAWTWLALLALHLTETKGRNLHVGPGADEYEPQEVAGELVAWVLDVDRRERQMETDRGVEQGALAGTLVYLPHRASVAAWLHSVGLQQVGRSFARRRGVAPGEIALDSEGGVPAQDEQSSLSRTPDALVTDNGMEGVVFGDLGSNWNACRGAVADKFVSGEELEALRLAAAVHWERTRESGLDAEAFSWALLGQASTGDSGKRLQATAGRLFLWLRLGDAVGDSAGSALRRAIGGGWISQQQLIDPAVGLASYLSDADVRCRHLERGGTTWGVHGRLQFAIFNLCAALTLGSARVEKAAASIRTDPALATWLSHRHKLGLEQSSILAGESPRAVFGPRGSDYVVARRSVWDMLETAEALVRLAGLMENAVRAVASDTLCFAVHMLRRFDPSRAEDVARLRDLLRRAHRIAPGGLSRMAAAHWLYDPKSGERDRLRSLVSAARAVDYPEWQLAEACARSARLTGWSELDGTPVLGLLRLGEEGS